MEAKIEKLLDMLTGTNVTLRVYANKKIDELDTRRQTISKAITELSIETILPQQIKKLLYYFVILIPGTGLILMTEEQPAIVFR